LVKNFLPPLEYYQKDLQTFIRIISLLADFALDLSYLNQSSFLFHQLMIIAEIVSDRGIKIKSFIAIAECAKGIK